MKFQLPLALCLALTPTGLFAQAKPASAGAASDSQEKNIQEYIQLMRTDVRGQATQIMGIMMGLDADQSVKFWPVYKDFQTDLSTFYDGVIALIKQYAQNYDSMTPAVADQLATKLLDLETQRNEIKRKYYQRFKAALDPIIAARFLQVENQLEHVLDLQISSNLPIIDR